MLSLTDYQTVRSIYESANSQVYRGIRNKDNQPVILKVLKENYPTPSELTRYKQEYQLTRSLNLQGVIKAYDLQPYQNTLVIILEDFGGESLRKLDFMSKISITQLLELFIKISESLGQLHSANIIHKDINPANIVLNPETDQIKLIDLGISTQLTKENPTLKNPNVLEGTLPYISPEQTGRMNRSLDYRTDFYSLGVSFYELLTQQLPFQTKDELELVHCHIAQKPPLASTINPNIPEVIAQIVDKLMAKNAEDRYQSSWGLKSDLETVLNQIQSTGKSEQFALGQHDISDKFQIPQKLYGRQSEITELIQTFEKVHDSSQIMLIAGYSGIGKSALVQEIYKPITEKRGYFISGKFDQFQRNIPYSAIVAAFKGFIQQILTETTENLQIWKDKFLEALGVNGQVLIDVIPEIELIIGAQPPVDELGPTEAQNRFNLVFQNFLRSCCQKEHPLVLFLDDLQWTDGATLKLIELMVTDKNLKHLFLIGAYRDNEVNPNHPLMVLVDQLQKSDILINQLVLHNLKIEDINHLIEDTVKCQNKQEELLADLILQKTGGNPFFVNQFLTNLYAENLIIFDYDRQEWRWDLQQIEEQNITDNVVELMIGKLRKLPVQTQEFLKLAACIGASFDLNTLSIVAEASPSDVFEQLIVAIQSGLILSLSELDPELLIQEYRFLHDRVQQAAYALIPEDDKPSIHLKIGQLLLYNTPKDEQEDILFDIVGHLNIGFLQLKDEVDKIEVIELNLRAGSKAKLSTAYKGAKEYLKAGIDGLDENGWRDHYQLTYALHRERCEVEYLSGDFDESKKWASLTLENSRSVLDKCEIYRILILQNTMSANYKEGFIVGKAALELLGIELPEHDCSLEDLKIELNRQQNEIRQNLGDRKIADLVDSSEIGDREKRMSVKLLSHVAPTMFFTNQNFWYIIVTRMVNLSLQYGLVTESAFGFITYAMLLVCVFDEYALSYEYGTLAVNVSQRFGHLGFKCQVLYLFASYVSSWRQHIKKAEPLNAEAFTAGLESGELPYAGYNLMTSIFELFYRGQPLKEVENKAKEFMIFTEETNNQVATDVIFSCSLVVSNLQGLTDGIHDFDSPDITEADCIGKWREYQSNMALSYYFMTKAKALYLYGEFAEALSCIRESEKFIAFMSSTCGVGQHNFYYSLILLKLYDQANSETQKEYEDRIVQNQKRMKLWSENAPENYLHKFLLIEAEIAHTFGEFFAAIDLYDRAIAGAKTNEYVNEQAIANELAAQFYMKWGKDHIAEVYLKQAHYCYTLWGALSKVKELEKDYSYLLTLNLEAKQNKNIGTTITRTSTNQNSATTLDIVSVVKANQVISGEIVLEKLLVELMMIIVRNAGAQTGSLILADEGHLLIQAQKRMDCDGVNVLQAIPVENSQCLSQTVVNYVVRTHESVVLNDASKTGNFINDPYVKQEQPKSILCVPLINQGKLVSIVYLENNLTTGAFTDDRVEMIQLLSGQAAISLENASLYKTLEQRVEQRTAELALANKEIGILNEKLQAENLRLSSELDVAKKIQQMVLPKSSELSEIEYLEIAGYMEPADEVGGDYYDVLKQGNRLKISIGDVTGHGLESGVLMLMAQTAVRTLQKVNLTDSVNFLDLLNQTLYDNLQRMNSDKNMTLSILDYQEGKVQLSGQHEEVILVRSDGEVELIDTIDLGFPIGLDAEIADFISECTLELKAGDVMVLYTDGITEAENMGREQYGLERLWRLVVQHRDRSADEIRKAIVEDIESFIGEQKVFDDITLVVLKQK